MRGDLPVKILNAEAIVPRWTHQPRAWQKNFWQIVVRVDSPRSKSSITLTSNLDSSAKDHAQ